MDATVKDYAEKLAIGYLSLPPDGQRFHNQFVMEALKNGNGKFSLPEVNQAAGGQPFQDTWKTFTLADAYIERPPVEYVVSGLFAIPSLNIVYGAPGTLKSFLLADLAVCAASGNPWLPPGKMSGENFHRSFSTRQCAVMWLDFDNGQRRTHDRFGALGRARQLSPLTPLYYYSMPNPWLNAGRLEDIGELTLRMRAHDARLVIIDNLGVVSGDADENSGDMVQVMSMFRQLSEDAGAAVVLIHHQRKSSGVNGRAGDSLRGHSSIEAALDLALLVERPELSETVTIKATKVRGADVYPFSAYFSKGYDNHDELHTACFYGVAVEDNRIERAIESAVMDILGDGAMNKSKLSEAVRGRLDNTGINQIRDHIEVLVKQGKLRVGPGRNNTEKILSRNRNGSS